MKNFDEYCSFVRKSTNFVSSDKNSSKFGIIEETLNSDRHNMLIGDVFHSLLGVYQNLSDLEKIDLIDYLRMERSYGRSCKKR